MHMGSLLGNMSGDYSTTKGTPTSTLHGSWISLIEVCHAYEDG